MPTPTSLTPRPRSTELIAGLVLLGLLLLAAFLGAWLTREQPLFSLLPPGGGAPDIRPDQRFDLHAAAFTAWAAVALIAPALGLVWWSSRSDAAGRWWRVLWTAALAAFAVHLQWSMGELFAHDWQRITHSSRVSAPRLAIVLLAWWSVDVLLAWWSVDVLLAWTSRERATWVRMQRAALHLLAFVMFFVGAAREGELLASRILGWALGVAAVAGVVLLLARRLRPRAVAAQP